MSRTLVQKIIEFETTRKELLLKQGNSIYTFLNPVSFLAALKHEKLFTYFDGIMVDGSILILAIQLLYGKKVKRRSFDMTSIASSLFQHAISEMKSVYVVGAKQEQVERSVEILKRQYPELQIAGYRNGYFSSKEEIEEECRKIIRINPAFTIAGMGTPLQEQFLLQLKEFGYKGIGFSCGGFISQLSLKGIQYYPVWADKYNIRFLYRMYKEKHTRKRYLKAAFLFPIYFVWNKLK